MSIIPLIVIGFGIFLGMSGMVPSEILRSMDTVLTWTVLFLCFVIGINIGKDQKVWESIISMGKSILVIPVMAITGSIFGGIAAGYLAGIPLSISTAASVGSGYYTVPTILLKQLGGPEAATIGFLSNLFRELVVMTSMPLVIRFFGRNGAIGVAGAAAMDTCLPFIIKDAGKDIALAALASGIIHTIAIPVMVPLCYRLFS